MEYSQPKGIKPKMRGLKKKWCIWAWGIK